MADVLRTSEAPVAQTHDSVWADAARDAYGAPNQACVEALGKAGGVVGSVIGGVGGVVVGLGIASSTIEIPIIGIPMAASGLAPAIAGPWAGWEYGSDAGRAVGEKLCR